MDSTAPFQREALDWKVYLPRESSAAIGNLLAAVTDTLVDRAKNPGLALRGNDRDARPQNSTSMSSQL